MSVQRKFQKNISWSPANRLSTDNSSVQIETDQCGSPKWVEVADAAVANRKGGT
jgi:hypothetical protein